MAPVISVTRELYKMRTSVVLPEMRLKIRTAFPKLKIYCGKQTNDDLLVCYDGVRVRSHVEKTSDWIAGEGGWENSPENSGFT